MTISADDMMSAPTPGVSRRDYLTWLAASAAVPFMAGCGGEGSDSKPGEDPESVRWFRDTVRTALNRPGINVTAVSVALMVDDRVVWAEAFGYADREKGVQSTPDMRVNIGSVAKIFAALAVMILRDRGRLTLDQPLAQLLPAFHMLSPGFNRITVRHLISHASGVPGTNARNVFNFTPKLDYAQDALRALANSRLKHEPGELSVYCNDGFTMVELLVRELTGLSYPEFIQKEILDPLGMSLSGYALTPAAEGTFVHPHYEGRRLQQEMPAAFATGGVVSTPTDMMKLARMLIDQGVFNGKRIVSAEGIRDMGIDQGPLARINLTPSNVRVGLGWDSVKQLGMEAAGLNAWSKNGGTTFFLTEFIVLPGARMAMMVNGNGHDYASLLLAEGLLLRTAVERKKIQKVPAAVQLKVPPLLSPAPDRTDLAGVYACHTSPFQVLAGSDGSLTLRRLGEDGWVLVQAGLRARTDGHWWADTESTRCYRFAFTEGRRYLVQREISSSGLYWNENPLGEWLPPLDTPLPKAWQDRVGSKWICTNDTSVLREFGPLTWEINALSEMPGYLMWDHDQLLRVINDNEAGMTVKIPVNAGRDLVEWKIVIEGGKEQLQSGGFVFERMA
ncbi:serine hydrolase domain-containing protein [Ottowia thiooxydans]|uniref:serine hydrolase domain-containing protein n=1 Tax=Ottowia thiooxydans TaxID=219182 RepID=UPI00040C7A5A|nr:serine hydrolase domain-containing protein [Ottowia thiooxydans]